MKHKVTPVSRLNVQIYADGADKDTMIMLAKDKLIKGLTTNPTLMRSAGIKDYAQFAREVLTHITKKPISFEVFSDDFEDMERQAHIIKSWGKNVYVKIPITNTQGKSSAPLISTLSQQGVRLNVTAILTLDQVQKTLRALHPKTPAIISVFAGRIADTGVDPVPIMKRAKKMTKKYPNVQLLWASPRQLRDIYDAEEAGADIITVMHDILKKLGKINYDHAQYSLDTVKMFYEDGKKAGFVL